MAKNPHAVALGRKGGKVTSKRKATASAANGHLGGRPKKAPFDQPNKIQKFIRA